MEIRPPAGPAGISMKRLALALILLLLPGLHGSPAQGSEVFFRDAFNDLENWRPVSFPRIGKHTRYTIESRGDERYLRAESNASASALVYRGIFNVNDYPKMKWRWRVSNVYQKGDVRTKAGDDYPLRIYILFQYDPAGASAFDRLRYAVAKGLYGEYPPHSALNYIWANREQEKGLTAPNPYAENARMIALQGGAALSGQWIEEQVHIVEDYRRVFASDPPPIASVGIMSDSDNTGEQAVSHVKFIEIFR
jgi:hypothetical protein